jgi:pullulanase/glycogen debranching enzyme
MSRFTHWLGACALTGLVPFAAPAFAVSGAALLPTVVSAQEAAPAPVVHFRAEVRGPRAVWARVTGGPRPLGVADYKLTDAAGADIPIAAVVPSTATETLVVPARDLDVTRVHMLSVPALNQSARVSFDGWFRTLYSDKPLGANVSADGRETSFRVFAPRATRLRLYTYRNETDAVDAATNSVDMTKDSQGVWEITLPGDFHGAWYDFRVEGPADPGNFFHGTHPTHISDPYARVNADAQGKSRVWRATRPSTGVRGGRPKMEDVVAYEVHVQDFTDLLPAPEAERGTLPGFTRTGLRNKRGEPIGFDHLVNLGVNVVHLLPMQEFLHYPDTEWQASFGNDPMAKAMGIDKESYEWGYRTTHAFAVETRYRKRGTERGAERDQFRDLVQAFHDRGIAVIIDIVPNHTGENMDGRNMLFNFNVLDRHYYYRLDDKGEHIGPFGNEVKTEDRPMTQRWIIDQMKHFMEEFGVDGFRIDLAGQIDEQTLIKARKVLPADAIIYGEPWIDVSDPVVRANPDWDWYKEDSPITFFQDNTRNALVGSPFRLKDKATDRGYAGGHLPDRENAMRAIANDWPEESVSPNQGLNYLDIHDNWTLADRFATRDWDGRQGVDEAAYRVAAGFLFTSLGPVVVHGGSEFMRSKGVAPIGSEIRQIPGGPIYFKGREDTYNIRTPNHFIWDMVGATKRDGPVDAKGMHAWWRGLIAFRRSETGKVFRLGTPPAPGHFRWITPENQALLGYVVGGQVLVLANVGDQAARFDAVELPPGNWRMIADGERIDHVRGVRGPDSRLTGGRTMSLAAPATSMRIWVKE